MQKGKRGRWNEAQRENVYIEQNEPRQMKRLKGEEVDRQLKKLANKYMY